MTTTWAWCPKCMDRTEGKQVGPVIVCKCGTVHIGGVEVKEPEKLATEGELERRA